MRQIRRLNNESAGFVNDVSYIIAKEFWKNPFLIPNTTQDKSTFIFSDYSFIRNYKTYSFLIIGRSSADYFNMARKIIRKDFNLKNRRMSFKGLNDKNKSSALFPFLSCAGAMDGLLITYAVDSKIKYLFAEQFLEVWQELKSLNKKNLEELLRIAHFGGMSIMNAYNGAQNIIWITDNDAFVANENYKQLFGRIAETLIRNNFLKGEEICKVGFGTTDIDNGSLELEDFTSIPDLAAGAICDMLNELYRKGLHITSKIILQKPNVKDKTNIICQWIAQTMCPLKKIGIVFDKFGDGKYDFRPTGFTLQNLNYNPCGPICNARRGSLIYDPIHFDFEE